MLQIDGVSRSFGSRLVLDDVGFTVQRGHLTGFVGVVAAWVGATWGIAQRHAGLLRREWLSWGVGAVAMGAGVVGALSLRDRPVLGEVPTLVPLLVCVALVVLAARQPSQVDLADEDAPDESAPEWFDRLAGVLRGRYYLSRRDVRHHVAEAQAFWRDTGATHPRDEFGSPQVYALRLLEGSARPRSTRMRLEALFYTLMTALAVALLVGSITDGEGVGDLLWRVAGLLLFGSLAVRAWRQGLPTAQRS